MRYLHLEIGNTELGGGSSCAVWDYSEFKLALGSRQVPNTMHDRSPVARFELFGVDVDVTDADVVAQIQKACKEGHAAVKGLLTKLFFEALSKDPEIMEDLLKTQYETGYAKGESDKMKALRAQLGL